MPKVLFQPDQFKRLLRRRRAIGADFLDEVWNGIYVMSPGADNEHQELAGNFVTTLNIAIGDVQGVLVYPTVNISDRKLDWRRNYRIPDASVFLPGNPAENCGSHWFGGPDFAVEILSPGDRSRQKLSFYAKVGVRELLLVDRQPWTLELFRRQDRQWNLVGTSDPDQSSLLTSAVLPLTFRLVPADPRPLIEVTRTDGTRHWLV
ncbi:MAG: Uma2 family endonuclease [Isosphaeraceae bacterium]